MSHRTRARGVLALLVALAIVGTGRLPAADARVDRQGAADRHPALHAATSIEGVPVCADHVPTGWHPLVKRDAVGAVACTHGHEHHDDPNAVNDIFGPPGAWAGVSGQAISYPWQTSAAAGAENVVKHEGYKWYVARDQPCRPAITTDPSRDGCFISWRVQVHTLGTASDAVVRFHSFSLEVVVEHQGRRGIVRHGGWLDTGHLALLVDGGLDHACPPLPSNPTTFVCGQGLHREASSANVPPPDVPHAASALNWYTGHLGSQVHPRIEEWGPTDYQAPARQGFFPPILARNNSRGRIENMAVELRYPWLGAYTDSTGLVRFGGYTDRSGNPVAGCVAAGVDCVPFVVDGAPRKAYLFNAGFQGLTAMLEHDVPSPVTGASLIRFPN